MNEAGPTGMMLRTIAESAEDRRAAALGTGTTDGTRLGTDVSFMTLDLSCGSEHCARPQ
jgi:hypothetical protein